MASPLSGRTWPILRRPLEPAMCGSSTLRIGRIVLTSRLQRSPRPALSRLPENLSTHAGEPSNPSSATWTSGSAAAPRKSRDHRRPQSFSLPSSTSRRAAVLHRVPAGSASPIRPIGWPGSTWIATRPPRPGSRPRVCCAFINNAAKRSMPCSTCESPKSCRSDF